MRPTAPALAMLIALTLAGCGGAEPGGTGAAPGWTPPAPGAAPEPARAGAHGVAFPLASARLGESGRETVRRLAAALAADPALRAEVTGRPDIAGQDAASQRLARQRAMALREALVGAGVAPARIETRWDGEAGGAGITLRRG